MNHKARIGVGLIAWLLLGLVIAVGATWLEAMRQVPEYVIVEPLAAPRWSHAEGASWYWRSAESHWRTRLHGVAATDWAASARRPNEVVSPPAWSRLRERPSPVSDVADIHEHAFGWPFRCLSYAEVSKKGSRRRVALEDGRRLGPIQTGVKRVMPLSPHLPGLAANSAVSGAAAWVLYLVALRPAWRGLLGARAFVRRRRGRCPKCAYDLRGKLDHGCPECGWGKHAEPKAA